MKKTAVLIAALAGLLLTAQAQAQAPGQGVYLGLSGSTVWTKGGMVYDDTVNEDTKPGGKIYGGYMSTDNWGVELGLHYLGTYDIKFANVKISDMQTAALSAVGVYTQPLFDTGFNVNLRFGLAFTEAKYTCVSSCGVGVPANVSTTVRGVSGTGGLGIGAKLSQAISVRVDFDHFGGIKHQVNLTEYSAGYDILSASVQVHF
jgi:outer membrane protein with beta-barrel domain